MARGKPVDHRKFTIDTEWKATYNKGKYIGQFVTILSVNKTRELMGAVCALFCCDCPCFRSKE